MAMNIAANDCCASVVELTISCRDLPDMDVLSKSDPMVVVWLQDPRNQGRWKEIGRTEIIWDNLNPQFSKKITMTYLFEERQMLRFEVYDIDSESNDLAEHDFIGKIQTSLGEIVASSNGVKPFERKLEDGPRYKRHGFIKIIAEEVSSCKEEFLLKFGAAHLPTSWLRFFGRKRFFFEIFKTTENAEYSLVYRSNTQKEMKPHYVEWPECQLNAYSLCNGDLDRSIKIALRQHRWNGSHKLMGELNTTIRSLQGQSLPASFMMQPSRASLKMISFSKGSHSTFLDFVRTGVQMHCFVAVDFTASNGDPGMPTSLHYISSHQQNHYEIALKSVLDIIQDYNTTKQFPALGFGARIPPNFEVSHQFFLNFKQNPYCDGVDGVMGAYQQAIRLVRLFGPTNFAPIINHVTNFAHSNRDGGSYFILLIITDGIICDMPQTINAIVAASSLPISIIIVGVGSAEFSAMNVLDADDTPLVDSNGVVMERDIVQFVPFNEILTRANNNLPLAKIDLAREVLAELPRQFLSYMKKIGVTAEQLAAKVKQTPC